MVKFISIFGLIISVLCFINNSVNSHPLFLKTIARASSGSSGLNSLNSYRSSSSVHSNQNNHNTAVNSNPLQGLINTKINIVGRALVQIGQAFENYGNIDNSGPITKPRKNVNAEAIIHSRVSSTTSEAPEPATFDIDTELDARLGDIDADIKNIEKEIQANGKKIKTPIKSTVAEDKEVISVDVADNKDDDNDKNSVDVGDEKIGTDDAEEKDSTDDAEEKDGKDDTDSDKDEALKVDLFKLEGGTSGNGFKLEESTEMKQDSADGEVEKAEPTDNGELEKDGADEDINNEGSESSDNVEAVNVDKTKNSGPKVPQNSNNGNQIQNTGNNNGETAGYQYQGSQGNSPGYNYDGGKNGQPRYQYNRPETIIPSPGYTYQSASNTQPGYNYQRQNSNPPGYNYQQGSNIKQNGYQPIVSATSINGYDYVQAGSQNSGIKINRIRSTTTGYHYPKPENSFSGPNAAQSSPYYTNGQLSPNNNYRQSVTVLSNPVPNSQILNSISGTVFNSQNSGIVNPSQILNNGFKYQTAVSNINTAPIYQSAVPVFNAAPNFNNNLGATSALQINRNINSNLGISSTVPTLFGNNCNANTAILNSRPIGITFNSGNTLSNSNANQRTNSFLQNQQSVQYSQNQNLNVNQLNRVPVSTGSSFAINSNQQSGFLQNVQPTTQQLTNPIIGLTLNRPTSAFNNLVSSTPNINQNSAISNTGRPFYAGNIGQSLVQTQQSTQSNTASVNQNQNLGNPNPNNAISNPGRPFYAGNIGQSLVQTQQSTQSNTASLNQNQNLGNQNSAISNTGRPFYAGNIGQSLSQNQQSFRSNTASINQNQNTGNNLFDNIAIIPSIAVSLNRPSSTTSSFAGSSNQGTRNQANNNQRSNNQSNNNVVQNQRTNNKQVQNNSKNQLSNNNQPQSIQQNQRISETANSFTQKPTTKPEIDNFAIIPSLVHPSTKKNKNTNVRTGEVQNQQSFNLNLNSGSNNNNNNNQRPAQQQQTFRDNTASNFNQNQNFQSQTFSQQNNQNINRNGFSGGVRQNQLGGQSLSDSTIQLNRNGYNIGNIGTGTSQGQTNQQNLGTNINSSNQITIDNDDADVSKSTINTLSALKNLSESEYYENGVKKLQYPKDDDDDVAFRSASNSLLVGDIRRYRKEIKPI